MVLFSAVPGKMYFEIRCNDIPPGYILGGRCIMCSRMGPVDRHLIEERHGPYTMLRHVDKKLRCRRCGNGTANQFVIYGRSIRKAPTLPAGVIDVPIADTR
ncbi:hypothetical protein MIC97_16635 [Aquamicrobium sp. NLF2-7]|uniref:hypothetical protein n=1 Tax=Aquamicrobium sp. NLF2-7 TaxID=2918753 RepID=UPI001EFAE574|nr:hypothetical protein [Aquamicrobium sp. NLF2-7]MCG8273127.1 hypothetical protein [Aquamicrobium sp. NLF2-7]